MTVPIIFKHSQIPWFNLNLCIVFLSWGLSFKKVKPTACCLLFLYQRGPYSTKSKKGLTQARIFPKQLQWKKKYKTDGNNCFNWHQKHGEEARNSYFTLQTNPLRKHSFTNKPPCACENSFQLANLGRITAKHKQLTAFCTSEKPRRIENRMGIKQTQLTSQRWILPIILSNLMLNPLASSPSTAQLFPNGFVVSHSLQHSFPGFHTAKVLQSTSPAPLTFWTAC